MSVIPIRTLLDELAEGAPEAIERLCEIRGLWRSRSEDRCEALARSYRGNHQEFLEDLRKQDLVVLLTEPTEIDGLDYYLPRAASYRKEELSRLAFKAFCEDGVPPGFERCDESEEGEDNGWEVEDEASMEGGDDQDDNGDLDEEEDDPLSDAYERKLLRDLEFSPEEAAKLLRPYQAQAVEAVSRSLNYRRPKILQLATGGGKTRVANDIVVRWLETHKGPVFWITKDWRLLLQAVRDLSRRHRGHSLARLGGDGHLLHPLPDRTNGEIVYTTLHTLMRRLEQGVLEDANPSLLVWDECHWGEHGRARRILTLCKRLRIPVLGLTATPRAESRFDVAFCKTFSELVEEGFLARPIIEKPVHTGTYWRPQFRSRFEDVSQASLRELAENRERNRRIVAHYVQHVRKYAKTILFACSIEHVNLLTELFIKQGIAARPIHSHQGEEFNRRALDDFRAGAVQVLVNMEMLTHGIDIPDARTVFLCRPTTSDILFAQMVGRAARRDEAVGKNSFFIVEFTDNIEEHGELFESAQRYFEGSAPGSAVSHASGGIARKSRGQRDQHVFDLKGAPTWIPSGGDLPESLQGLWYRHGQSFGVEIELTTEGEVPPVGPKWRRIAEFLRERLAEVLPGCVADQVIEGYAGSEGGKDCSVWNVEYDSSAGWEVTSRILVDAEGFLEVDTACRTLDTAAAEVGLLVNFRTGTHIHIGWLGQNVGEVKRAIRLARLFEPALATLVAPSRIVHFDGGTYRLGMPNQYCRPMASVFDSATLDRVQTLEDIRRLANGTDARYVTFNLKPLEHLHTVEVRLHSGTLEARKILLWVSLWQQILWAAAHRREIPMVPDMKVIEPNGDIVALALEYLPDGRQPQQQALLQRLITRRSEIVEQWKAHPHLRPWAEFANRWMHVPA